MLTTYYTEVLLDLKDIKVIKVLSDNASITIYLEQKRKHHACPACTTATGTVHDYREQVVRDIPMLGKSVVLIVRKDATSVLHAENDWLKSAPCSPDISE